MVIEFIINTINYILTNIVAFLAFITSIITILITNRHNKSQRFINIVTTQRIKWIEELRSSLSDVLSSCYLVFRYKDQTNIMDLFEENVGYDNSDEALQGEKFKTSLKELKNSMDNEISKVSIIKNVDKSILRLNPSEDESLILKLDEIKESLIQERYDSEFSLDFFKELRNLISSTLKREWEKVKSEAERGKMQFTVKKDPS